MSELIDLTVDLYRLRLERLRTVDECDELTREVLGHRSALDSVSADIQTRRDAILKAERQQLAQ